MTDRDLVEYAGDDAGFMEWLREVDAACQAKHGVSIMDLPDACWRDAYDDKLPASEAIEYAIEGSL